MNIQFLSVFRANLEISQTWLENGHLVFFTAVADIGKKILSAVGDGGKNVKRCRRWR
jgi:hypothetical protein